MAVFPVESSRLELFGTGVVRVSAVWEQDAGGKWRSTDEQACVVDPVTGVVGLPLWEVEVMTLQSAYGKESFVSSAVVVPAVKVPVVARFAPVSFVGLEVEVRVGKGGGLQQSWKAAALSPASAASAASAAVSVAATSSAPAAGSASSAGRGSKGGDS